MSALGNGEGLFSDTAGEAWPFLDDFEVSPSGLVYPKLVAFQADQRPAILLIDFDHTITPYGVSVWEALHKLLPDDIQRASKEDRDYNLPRERARLLTPEEHMKWSWRELGRLVLGGITQADITAAMRIIELRQGARQLIKRCAVVGIETHVVSSSVADAIESVPDLLVTAVHANRLENIRNMLSTTWEWESWDRVPIVHSGNKHQVIGPTLASRATKGWIFVVGDTPDDAQMVEGDGKVVRIRVPGKDGNTSQYLTDSFEAGYDLVLKDEGLEPVGDLLVWGAAA